MIYQLHHIHLLCSDLEQTIDFFTQKLGAALLERKKFGDADGASLNLNGTLVNIRIAKEGEQVQSGNEIPQYGYHHIGLKVEDVEKAYNELSGKGCLFFKPPRASGRSITAFLYGPDKIMIELMQRIG